MGQIIGSGSPTRQVIGTTDADDFNLTTTQLVFPSTGVPANVTYPDVTVNRISNLIASNFNISVNKALSNPRQVTIINKTPAVCDTFPNGDVIAKAGAVGNASIDVFLDGVGTRNVTQNIQVTTQTKDTGIVYNNNSLGKHIRDNILGLIAGKNPTDPVNLPRNVVSGTTRNPTAFISGLDFSGVQWQAGAGKVTLISKRHGITCEHSHGTIDEGDQVTFRSMDNSASQTVTVVRSQKVAGSRDLYIAYFNADVTVATPYKILPDDIATYLPSNALGVVVPALSLQTRFYLTDNTLNYSINGLTGINQSAPIGGVPNYGSLAVKNSDSETNDDVLFSWSNPLVTDDSGTPFFLPIKENTIGTTQLVLVGVTHYPTFQGDNLSLLKTTLDSTMRAMRDVGDTFPYEMSIIGLSGFLTY
jgi:hypothetical protein